MARVYDIDKEKLTASLKVYDMEVRDDISVHIDSEEHRIWFEGISSIKKPWVENAFYRDLFGEIITNENDLAFIGEIIDIRNEIAKQITEGIEHNIEAYRNTIEQIDNDSNVAKPMGYAKYTHKESTTNPLSTAIQDFQKVVASYLNNENISRYSWGTETLADFVKGCVRMDDEVAVSVNDLAFDVSVSFEMDGEKYLKTEKGMTDREIAKEIVGNADYFLIQDEYIQGADTLYDLAIGIIKHDETVKQIEGAKDNLAVAFVKANGDKDKLLADDDLYFEWFKDTFGHSFGKEGYDDEAMLNHRFAQMVEDGRVLLEKVFSIENIAEIKAPSVITAYSMTLFDKANEIKELIDNCAIRSDEKGRPNIIEIWSDINDRGDNMGNIRIVNGGEAIKLSYKEQECIGAYYNDHIFQKNLGEWKTATEVFDTDGMKKPLYDIFSHLLQPSEFNPRLADDEVKNQNRNKGNTAPKR